MLYLRDWRRYKKLTLQELEALTGFPFRNLSKYELGLADPHTSTLPRLAAALGITVGDLFTPPPGVEETVHAHD